ncbi:MAG: excinuclease ABC subunit UvrA [Candidatus Liptonbacteria bacterium]|nr:excinuclease ABC subunit UvrA [Candidatus Liptonbacteria bacterium]
MSLSAKFTCPQDSFSFPEIEPRLFSFNSPYGACQTCHGLGTEEIWSEKICPACLGKRLREESLNVLIDGKNIASVVEFSIAHAHEFFGKLEAQLKEGGSKFEELRDEGKGSGKREFSRGGKAIRQPAESGLKPLGFKQDSGQPATGRYLVAETPLREIKNRLKFMIDVGLDYLTLERRAGTLSGGESQRIRLASQIGSRLVGTLYILDEPTIGLHQKDNAKLIKTLHELRDLGNTIIVVEHDEETIRKSDYLVDIGPGAGVHGGKIIAQGTIPEIIKDVKKNNSLTLDYLRGHQFIEVPKERRKVANPPAGGHDFLKVKGATANNLQNINVDVPLRRLTAVTGVSGSGKSSLVYDVIFKTLANKFNPDARYRGVGTPTGASGRHRPTSVNAILGTEYINRVINIDQSPIGRTPRSNPATYVGAWTFVRELFASTEDARVRGWKPGRFSFNVPGGRCENCEGHGYIAIEMHFLPTVYVECEVCKGKRFDRETLEVEYSPSHLSSKDRSASKNIYDILKLTIEEAVKFFKDIPHLHDRLSILEDVGLGYLELGQSATTLSGGEAQRIKLSAELGKRDTRRTLYLLDEPTTGLHFADVDNLLKVLQRLVERGNTVVVIEHNLDVIKTADWVIDLGPEGGDKGGRVVAAGTPEEISRKKESFTGEYLRRVLK